MHILVGADLLPRKDTRKQDVLTRSMVVDSIQSGLSKYGTVRRLHDVATPDFRLVMVDSLFVPQLEDDMLPDPVRLPLANTCLRGRGHFVCKLDPAENLELIFSR